MFFITLLFVGASAENRGGFFTPERDFNDKIMSTNIIDVLEGVGQEMECWMSCLEDLSCVSVFYRQGSGQCQLHDVLFLTQQDADQDNGTLYFSVTTGLCPPGYVHARNLSLCYRMGLEKIRYADVVSDCASRGEHLIVIDSADKQNHFVKQVTASSGASAVSYFIDGTDQAEEGQWRYHDGRTMAYQAFMNGYPMATTPDHDVLVASKVAGLFMWQDRKAAETKYYICERDISP